LILFAAAEALGLGLLRLRLHLGLLCIVAEEIVFTFVILIIVIILAVICSLCFRFGLFFEDVTLGSLLILDLQLALTVLVSSGNLLPLAIALSLLNSLSLALVALTQRRLLVLDLAIFLRAGFMLILDLIMLALCGLRMCRDVGAAWRQLLVLLFSTRLLPAYRWPPDVWWRLKTSWHHVSGVWVTAVWMERRLTVPIHAFKRWSTGRHGPKLSWTVHYWLGPLRRVVALHHSWILTLVVVVMLTGLAAVLQLLVSVLCLLFDLFLKSSVPCLAALDL